jgi:hypothetical protein
VNVKFRDCHAMSLGPWRRGLETYMDQTYMDQLQGTMTKSHATTPSKTAVQTKRYVCMLCLQAITL